MLKFREFLVAHAMRLLRFEKLVLDFGAVSPFAKLLFFEESGVGFAESEGIALDAEVLGVEIAAAKTGDISAEFAEPGPLDAGIGFGSREVLSGGSEAEDEPAGKLFGESAGERFIAERMFVVEASGELEGILADLPIVETALFPFGKIL